MSTEVTSKIQYAVKAAERPGKPGQFVDSVCANTHFSFSAEGPEGAELFNTAAEAEAKTKAGRTGVSWLDWIVVPVKVTTTTITRPVTSETREVQS